MAVDLEDQVRVLGNAPEKLKGFEITRVNLDTEHFYFGKVKGETKHFISLTRTIDIGGPFPEGLRDWLRVTSFEESKERLAYTGARGSGLHDALDQLIQGKNILMEDFKTAYEKEALDTFRYFFRFLWPKKSRSEFVVGDPDLQVAGTMDLFCLTEEYKLIALLDPNKYLERDAEGDWQLKEAWADLPLKYTKKVRVVIDWKFTGRTAYNHLVQVAAYKSMLNKSRPDMGFARRAFTWRFSPGHKAKFVFTESFKTYQDFKRIYFTAMDYLGAFPNPPELKVYPKEINLFGDLKY